MKASAVPTLPRRSFLAASGAAVAASMLPSWRGRAASTRDYRLVARPARSHLVGPPHPETAVWAYNDTVPGPEIRVRQGERVRITVENQLGEETTIHWHGLRVPNAMDGVPHLTQPPIAPGESFVYAFAAPDAGTYWYHPHQRSFEQVGRGLYGPLIVEEEDPIQVDRDVTWVLDDWRLLPDAQISDDFGGFMDSSHNGRVGNTVTVNGRILETFAARAGERVRLRLINAANARIFGLEFQGHAPMIVALDGQPVEPHVPAKGRVVLGPAMRADLVLDMMGSPAERFTVVDTFYQGLEYRLLDLAYEDAPPLRDHPPDAPVRLAANTMPEPDLEGAERHEVSFGGGMMGGMMAAMMDGRRSDMREMMRSGMAWAINGVVASGHAMDPLLTLRRGQSYVLG
ncbi:MAG TPA: multicopper oxidase domain-containing protein, partial [Geminicoccaceae bacterium]|nr:multicopper oxidase domain-containing protein [Geminicoccaceae bacterium]